MKPTMIRYYEKLNLRDITKYKQTYGDKVGRYKAVIPIEDLIDEGKNLLTTIITHIAANGNLYEVISIEYDSGDPIVELILNPMSKTINILSKEVYQDNIEAGWWTDLETGVRRNRNVGELLCLVHSEISEAMEGYRKNLKDDKLPHRDMFEVELADAMIRIFDIAGAHFLDLDGAIREKREYNAHRADHKIENRKADGGKKF